MKDGSLSIAKLEALYRLRFAEFARVASAIAGDGEAGVEAVQEAFARAIRLRSGFRGDGSVEAWVWRIVVNCARSARSVERDHAMGADASTLNSSPASGRDGVVLAWIAALPPRQREAVFLRYFADLDYRTIAALLGVEVGTVSATLHAAHTNIRKTMEATR